MAFPQGLSIPTWTGITSAPTFARSWCLSGCELYLCPTGTPSSPFHRNSSSSFISIWTFCDFCDLDFLWKLNCHYWVLSGWFRGTFPPPMDDVSVTLSPQIKKPLWRRWSRALVKLWERFKLDFTPQASGRRRNLLSVYDQTSDGFSCDDVGCPDILPARKKTHFFSYFHDNLLISNIQGSSSTLRTNFWLSQLFLAVSIIHVG